MPGTDVAEAQRVVLGELPDLPHLVELPARGPGAEIIGRGAGLLVELPVELYAARWRVADRPGRDLRRTRDLLERDLDQLTEQAAEYRGPLKVQVAGPWTLAAGIDLRAGGRMLRDPGAVRDLTASLAEGVGAHVAEITARVPGAELLLQLDEPSLPAVLAGRVPTESGLGMLPMVEPTIAAEVLGRVVSAAGVPVVVHCCAPDVPLAVLRQAGAAAVALDLDLLDGFGAGSPGAGGSRPGGTASSGSASGSASGPALSGPASGAALDALGEAIDAGLGLFAGALRPVPRPAGAGSSGDAPAGPASTGDSGAGTAGSSIRAVSMRIDVSSGVVADRVRMLWRRLGFPAKRLPDQVVVTPACGLAGTQPGNLRSVMAACRDAARRLRDEAEA